MSVTIRRNRKQSCFESRLLPVSCRWILRAEYSLSARCLFYTDLLSETDDISLFDAVQPAKIGYRRSVFVSQGTQRFPFANRVVATGGLFDDLFFVHLFVGDFVVEILPRIRIDAEERFFEQECFAAKNAVFEVDQPLGVERMAVVTGFEVQVRACRTACRSAQTDDLARLDPLVRLDQTFCEVAVISLQPIVVADDDQVAVTSVIILRYAYTTAECGVDRVTGFQRQVDSLMLTATPRSEFSVRVDASLIGAMVTRYGIEQRDDDRLRQLVHIDLSIRKESCRAPVFLENRTVFGYLAVKDVFPRVVAVKNHPQGGIARVEGVDDRQIVRVGIRQNLFALEAQTESGDGIGGVSVDFRFDLAGLCDQRFVLGCRCLPVHRGRRQYDCEKK